MVQRNVAAGRLRFTTDAADGGRARRARSSSPSARRPDEDGSADLQLRARGGARHRPSTWTGCKVVVDKSTVPVGTADKVRAAIAEELAARGVDIAFDVVVATRSS